MGRVQELRTEAQRLYAEASTITHGDDRLLVILHAKELDTEADVIERDRFKQQQQQPNDDKE